jgi:lysophospholipase L1-like esterase
MSLTIKLMLSPVLVAQAVLTKARMPRLPEPGGVRQGTAGRTAGNKKALRLLIAGDSSAVGVGVVQQQQALAPQLAQRVAEHLQAPVQWQLHAQAGLTTAQTLTLLQEAQVAWPVDVAVVVTGVNDVVDQIPSQRALAARAALANWLRNAQGVQHVVFAPLPPVHQFPGLPQPLRWVAGTDAVRHNAALQAWAQTRQDVSCVDMQMPLNPGVMAEDGFHPGEPVYRYCAGAIAEHLVWRVWPHLGVA